MIDIILLGSYKKFDANFSNIYWARSQFTLNTNRIDDHEHVQQTQIWAVHCNDRKKVFEYLKYIKDLH